MMSIENWKDFCNRSNHTPISIDYFTARLAQNKPVTSMMTIGSGTCENECALLTRGLSDLKDLHIIESHEARGIECLKQLNRNVKIHSNQCVVQDYHHDGSSHINQCVVQDYHHDGSSLDLILMIQCIYYLVPDMKQLVKRMKLWLSDNGKLVIAYGKSKLHDYLEVALDHGDVCISVDHKWLCEILEAEGFQYNVDILDFTINVADMKDNNFKWVGIFINREVQENEYEQLKAAIQSMKKDESAEEIIAQIYVVTASVAAI